MTKTEPSREEFLEKVASLEEGVQEDFLMVTILTRRRTIVV